MSIIAITIEEMKNQLLNSGLNIFEIQVTDQSKEEDYITFDISVDVEREKFVAQHIGLTKEEEASELIACKEIDFDDCFSLDEHLQELHTKCTEAIITSDFYQLKEDE